MGKNSKYKSPHSQKKRFNLSTMDVHLSCDDGRLLSLTMSPQEAFHVVSMPSFAGFISSMEPNYELSEVPEEGK